MILGTGKKGWKRGINLIEFLISILILSLFLIPTFILIQRYNQNLLLSSTAERVIEGLNLAREYALNEKKNFYVTFDEKGYKILRENKEIIGKKFKFPDGVVIKEKSGKINPLIFRPDGTTNSAGYIIFQTEKGNKRIKVKIMNLTGKVIIEK